jgi:DNA-binding CsgD family transcriptional regulator/tetratricopeptide (TPR) repeat protein/energy-coupling factor transporter ATP-binding protein EcfA2
MGSRRPVPLPGRFAAARRARLVGRRNELQVFERIWPKVEAGDGQVVLIGGEPGSGKTRLAAELAGALHDHGVTVLVGAASKDAGVPYEPFAQILDHLLEHGERRAIDELLEGAPVDLGRLSARVAPRLRAGADDTSGDIRRDLFDALAMLFRRLSQDRPLTVIVEDLHWATLPTVALLGHLASACVDARTLLVASLRTTAPDHSAELSERLAELHRLDGVHRLDLGGLDTDAIAEFVSDHAGIPLAGARAPAAMLRDRTGGNPFFLRELWADLERRGGVSALRGRQHIPASIADTVGARMAGLGPAVRQTIELAAVLGETFDVATLIRAGEGGRGPSIDAVDAATAVGLLEPLDETPARYGFVHALTREVVLDRLPSARLRLLNARVAEALDRGPASTPALYPRLAHHYLGAYVLGYHAQALHYTMLAARRAESSLAFEDAAEWFERASALPEASLDDVAEALFGAAENHVRAGDFARARDIYERLTRMPDPLVALQAATGFEEANWRPGLADTRAADLVSTAIDQCGLGPDDVRYVRAIGTLGRALAFAGQPARARSVGDRAIAMARRGGDHATLAHTLRTSLWHGLAPDIAERELQRVAELSALAIEHRDHQSLGEAAHFGAVTGYLLGRPAELEHYARQLQTAALAAGQPFISYVDTCVAQGRAFLHGDFSEAERLAHAALAIGEFDSESTEGPHGVQMFMVRREAGELERFRDLVTGHESFTGRWLPGLLALYSELGLTDGVRRALHVLVHRDLEARVADAQWPIELGFMAEAAADLPDEDAARRLKPFVARYEGMNIVAGQLVAAFGSADRFLARFEELSGDRDRADRLFASALAMDRRMGSVVHEADTLAQHAMVVHQRGDDPVRAEDLARQASAVATSIGQVRVLRRLRRIVSATSPGRLTDRELEVLRLLADGLSNREIGERLFISANTAANHVRNILMKTGAANRTQAARYANQHRLA